MISLLSADPEEVKKYFPSFFWEDSKFFFIMNGDKEAGVYAITNMHDERWFGSLCEISVCIFPVYQYKLPYRQIMRWCLYYPFFLSYDNILISSNVKSIITLLNVCSKMGVTPLGESGNKQWFCLRKRG